MNRKMNKKQQEQWETTLKLVWPFVLIGLFLLFIGTVSGLQFLIVLGFLMSLIFLGLLVW